jgi:hypothetical protein
MTQKSTPSADGTIEALRAEVEAILSKLPIDEVKRIARVCCSKSALRSWRLAALCGNLPTTP